MNAQSESPVQISIIVPVYNVADYLHECLQSIVEQDYAQAFEAILVDDCSTDGSADICREFSVAYPEIFILIERETNGGVSVARNRGLEQVKGRYLMFVDPDDILPVNALKLLSENMCTSSMR